MTNETVSHGDHGGPDKNISHICHLFGFARLDIMSVKVKAMVRCHSSLVSGEVRGQESDSRVKSIESTPEPRTV